MKLDVRGLHIDDGDRFGRQQDVFTRDPKSPASQGCKGQVYLGDDIPVVQGAGILSKPSHRDDQLRPLGFYDLQLRGQVLRPKGNSQGHLEILLTGKHQPERGYEEQSPYLERPPVGYEGTELAHPG